MRLNRFLATAGVGSRRSVEALILQSRVQVNGHVAELHTQVEADHDTVLLDGRPVTLPARHTYVILHKPKGYTVTRSDPKALRTVYDLLPQEFQQLAYVGRLDRESEGLLLFTDNGELNHLILRPASGVRKTYLVQTSSSVSKASERVFVNGITLPDGLILRAAQVSFTAKGASGGGILRIVLTEGKKREIRRMCEHQGIEIQRLKRVSIGSVRLGDLPSGKFRRLSEMEVLKLEELVFG